MKGGGEIYKKFAKKRRLNEPSNKFDDESFIFFCSHQFSVFTTIFDYHINYYQLRDVSKLQLLVVNRWLRNNRTGT